eukprot:6391027-Pyramimonas_sp.AAC.1
MSMRIPVARYREGCSTVPATSDFIMMPSLHAGGDHRGVGSDHMGVGGDHMGVDGDRMGVGGDQTGFG